MCHLMTRVVVKGWNNTPPTWNDGMKQPDQGNGSEEEDNGLVRGRRSPPFISPGSLYHRPSAFSPLHGPAAGPSSSRIDAGGSIDVAFAPFGTTNRTKAEKKKAAKSKELFVGHNNNGVSAAMGSMVAQKSQGFSEETAEEETGSTKHEGHSIAIAEALKLYLGKKDD